MILRTDVRVLQVVLTLNPGGTERLVVDLTTRLPDIDTAVCCLDELGAWGEELRGSGTVVTALSRSPGFRPMLGKQVAAAARAHRATVIHAHQYTPFVYAALAKPWVPAIPIVFTEHGRQSDAPPSPKRRRINRILRRVPGATFAVSKDLKQFMIAEGFTDAGVGVIYNGIDLGPLPSPADREAVRRELGVPPAEAVVTSVARFDPVKNLETLLESAAVPSTFPTTVVLIGDGPERRRLEEKAASLGLGRRARFLGHREDARRWLAGSDVYVNCSTSEGVSLTILEGMAAGLPVVATRVGGTPEVVPSSAGVLVPPRDSRALADAISALAADRERSRAMGAAGRQHVENAFTIERMLGDYRRVYYSVMAGAA